MGYHTRIVEKSLRLGFMLFLLSEVMFFFGFFWALLHFSLTGEAASGNI
jgi:cytochrome c oxidase subunit 3